MNYQAETVWTSTTTTRGVYSISCRVERRFFVASGAKARERERESWARWINTSRLFNVHRPINRRRVSIARDGGSWMTGCSVAQVPRDGQQHPSNISNIVGRRQRYLLSRPERHPFPRLQRSGPVIITIIEIFRKARTANSLQIRKNNKMKRRLCLHLDGRDANREIV